MDQSQKVSVIIPSYNHAKFIEKTVRSVISQTYRNIELIVLDDGSRDSSPELLRSLQKHLSFQLVLKENEGLCATLNRGIELATGDYVVIFGSDDIMPPTRIQEQINAFDRFSDADVICGDLITIDENDEVTGERLLRKYGWITFPDMIKRNPIFAPATMIRKSVFDRFGKYDPNAPIEDFYMWMKILSEGGRIYCYPRTWAYYRILNGDLEKKWLWYYRGLRYVLNNYRDRSYIQNFIPLLDLRFAVRMTALLGKEAVTKYPDVISNLPNPHKKIIDIILLLPDFIRRSLIHFLPGS